MKNKKVKNTKPVKKYTRLTITKETFVELLTELRKFLETMRSAENTIRPYNSGTGFALLSFYEAPVNLLISLLEAYYDTDIISWWIFECDCGQNHAIAGFNKKTWNLNTPEKLYDYIIKYKPGRMEPSVSDSELEELRKALGIGGTD